MKIISDLFALDHQAAIGTLFVLVHFQERLLLQKESNM